MIKFKAVLSKEIFKGDGGYLIASVYRLAEEEELVIVGYMQLLKDQVYEFTGEEIEHKTYGTQINISKYNLIEPTEMEQVIDFLSSASFEQVGKRTAKKIYDVYQEQTLEKLKNEPEEVKINVPTVKETIIDEINNKLNKLDGMEIINKLLYPLSFSQYYINEVYKYIQLNKINNVNEYIKTKPYQMIENIDGFNFNAADKIFLYYNKEDLFNDYRIKSAIIDEIQQMCFRSGDTYVIKENLLDKITQKLNLKINNFDEILVALTQENKIYIKKKNIVLQEYYNTEKQIATNIINRLDYLDLGLDQDEIEQQIEILSKKSKINYSKLQKKAILNSLSSNISIITGGPGTGKTTIIDAVVKIFKLIKYKNKKIKDVNEKIMLCAPTGRAAQRMKETTGLNAKTIHSLLEWDPYKNEFNRGFDNPLAQDLIIIDEFSMVDIFLAGSLLKAIKPSSIIIIVGDSAQLESVNPGNVLHDLIDYSGIPLVHLDVIYRQGNGSSIAQFAGDIDKGKNIEFVNTNDMSLINRQSNIVNIVKTVVEKSYVSGYNEMEVQVLYPKYAGKNGIDKINEILLPNKAEKYLEYNEVKYYIKDKVMQLKNDYEKNIFNGDIGFVSKIYQPKGPNDLALEITFKEKKVNIARTDLINIKHAYAISIHKSQGSEFPVVIMPISKESKNMLTKKLIYTAITRAKDKLIVIGEMDCLKDSVNIQSPRRKTYLAEIFK